MTDLDPVRRASERIKDRLVDGAIQRPEYEELRETILGDLTPEEQAQVEGHRAECHLLGDQTESDPRRVTPRGRSGQTSTSNRAMCFSASGASCGSWAGAVSDRYSRPRSCTLALSRLDPRSAIPK